MLSQATFDALEAEDRKRSYDEAEAALTEVARAFTSEAPGARRIGLARRFFERVARDAPRLLAIAVQDVIASDATLVAKARLAAAALLAAPRDQSTAFATLMGLDRLHPGRAATAAEADALAALIEAADATWRGDLTRALGVTLRGYVQPPFGRAAAEALSLARLDRIQTRIGLWRAGRLLSRLGRTEEAARAAGLYAARYAYHRDELDPRRVCGRLLVLNACPLIQADSLAGVHNHCNLTECYAALGRERPLALDILLLKSVDFDSLRDQIAPPDAVLNNLGDAETMERLGCAGLVQKIAEHFGAPLINPPDALAATARDAAAARIGDRGRISHPKTVRLAPELDVDAALARVEAEFEGPVVIRRLAKGARPRLTGSAAETRDALTVCGFGVGGAGAYAAAFRDCRDADGRLRRFRLYRVDGALAGFSLSEAAAWDEAPDGLAGGDDADAAPEAAQPPAEAIAPPGVLKDLDAALAETGLDICGVDFALTEDGRAVIFEMNAALRVDGRQRRALDLIGALLERRAAGHRARIETR